MSAPSPPPTRCGRRLLHWGERTLVMGIVNVTPDSFSGDGQPTSAAAVAQATAMVAAGADLLDIGGESTRPGATPITAAEEQRRVLPVIEQLAARLPDTPLSIDTFKAATAAAALGAGATIVNDVWGLRHDPAMAGVVAAAEAAVIIMHNRTTAPLVSPTVGGHYAAADYGDDLIGEIIAWLRQSLLLAERAGIPSAQIIIDPGIGFGKGLRQNLEVIRRLAELRRLGHPLLLGASRKSFLGRLLGTPPEDRLEGTAAAVAVGITNGADIVRVHDVASLTRVVRVTDAIVRQRRPSSLVEPDEGDAAGRSERVSTDRS